LPFFLLINYENASDCVCSGKSSDKSKTNTEFVATNFGSSLENEDATPTITNKPSKVNMMSDNKLAKTILKKLFMY